MDQISETKTTLQTLIDQKKVYDDVTADITTAASNAETAVSNGSITEGASDETVSSVLDDIND